VQVLEGEGDLGGVEARLVIGEARLAAQVGEQLAPRHILEEQVHAPLVLQVPQQVHDVGVTDGGEDAHLRLDVVHLLQADDLRARERERERDR
jgi:hypothetical protein